MESWLVPLKEHWTVSTYPHFFIKNRFLHHPRTKIVGLWSDMLNQGLNFEKSKSDCSARVPEESPCVRINSRYSCWWALFLLCIDSDSSSKSSSEGLGRDICHSPIEFEIQPLVYFTCNSWLIYGKMWTSFSFHIYTIRWYSAKRKFQNIVLCPFNSKYALYTDAVWRLSDVR